MASTVQKCVLCSEDATWKCLDCDNVLCHQCRKDHLKNKNSANNKVSQLRNIFINQSKCSLQKIDATNMNPLSSARKINLSESDKLSQEGAGKLSVQPTDNLSQEGAGKLSVPPIDNLSQEGAGKLSVQPTDNLSQEGTVKLSVPPIDNLSQEGAGKVGVPRVNNLSQEGAGKVGVPHVNNLSQEGAGKVGVPRVNNLSQEGTDKTDDPNMNSLLEDRKSSTTIQDSSYHRYPLEESSDMSSSNCDKHKTEVIQAYCEECQKAVCMDCIISGTHQNHHLQKMEDVIKENINELEKVLTSSEQEVINYTELLTEFQIIKENYSVGIAECVNKIKNHNEKLKTELDQVTAMLIQQTKQVEEEYNQQVEQQETLVQIELSTLKQLIQTSKKLQKTKNIQVVKLVTELKQRLEKFKSFETPQQANPPGFVAKEANIADIFGSLDLEEEKASDFEMTIISTPKILKTLSMFTHKNIVVTVSEHLAWLGKCGHGDVTMVTDSGVIIEEIKTEFDVYDLAVTKTDNELLATTFQSNKVKKVKGGKFIDLYSAPKYHNAKGITVTNDNNILVCFDNVDICEGKVLKLSPNGQVMNTIKYDVDGKTLLFRYPYRITSNKNGDIIVTASSDNILTGLDKDGKRRFAYSGEGKVLKRRFVPHGITTDTDGDIIIADYYNSAVHLVNKDGVFVRFILDDNHLDYPAGISVDKLGRLWICNSRYHKILIVQYK